MIRVWKSLYDNGIMQRKCYLFLQQNQEPSNFQIYRFPKILKVTGEVTTVQKRFPDVRDG